MQIGYKLISKKVTIYDEYRMMDALLFRVFRTITVN